MGRDGNLTALPSAGLMAATFLVLTMLAGADAASAQDRVISVSGNSVPSDCGAPKKADLGLELEGSLEGCWAIFVQHLTCRELNGFALTTELGREEFEGKLDGEPVKLETVYAFTATWPSGSCPQPAVEKETSGSCIHYVAGERLGGVIRFHDVIPVMGKGATNFLYEGVLTRS